MFHPVAMELLPFMNTEQKSKQWRVMLKNKRLKKLYSKHIGAIPAMGQQKQETVVKRGGMGSAQLPRYHTAFQF